VIVLSDGYLANGAEPWLIPDPRNLPDIDVRFRTDPEGFEPYAREEATLARPWVRPGTPGLEHRIGGLEKQHVTGNVSYDPDNHDLMVRLRAEKVRRSTGRPAATSWWWGGEGPTARSRLRSRKPRSPGSPSRAFTSGTSAPFRPTSARSCGSIGAC